MQRASRIIVFASIIAAGLAHGWLTVNWQPYLGPTALIAFIVSFLIARRSLYVALLPALATIYFAPAVLFRAFGVYDFPLLVAWLALLAGPVLAHTPLDRWRIPGWWGVLFAAWAVVIAVTWPIVAGREIDFSVAAARTLDSPTAMYQGPPPLAAAWIVTVAMTQMLGMLWVDFLWGVRHRFERWIVLPLIASAVIGAIAAIYQATVDLTWMNPEFWVRLRRAGGFMLDANTVGITGALWAPIAAVLVWRRRLPAWTAAIAYAALASATWASGSRTALLTLGAGTAGIIVALLQRRGWWQPRMAPIVLLVGAALLVLAMFIAPRGGNSPSPLQRVFDRLPRPEAADLSRFANEMWTRFGYGTVANRIMRDHPATGVGVGAFHILLNDYIHRETGDTLPPDNAQNWWRHQLAELGIVGAAPSIAISILLIALIWRGGPYVEPLGSTTVLRLVLTGVGVASVLGVPTQHPATWISFLTLLFWLLALYRREADDERALPRWAWAAVLIVGAATATGQAVSARADLRAPERALWTGAPYRYGFAPPEGLSEYGELRWMSRRALEVMPVEREWLQLAFWPPTSNFSQAPLLDVRVNHQTAIQDAPITAAPVVYYVRTTDQRRWVMIELAATNASDDERALAVAMDWVHNPPANTPADRIIR